LQCHGCRSKRYQGSDVHFCHHCGQPTEADENAGRHVQSVADGSIANAGSKPVLPVGAGKYHTDLTLDGTTYNNCFLTYTTDRDTPNRILQRAEYACFVANSWAKPEPASVNNASAQSSTRARPAQQADVRALSATRDLKARTPSTSPAAYQKRPRSAATAGSRCWSATASRKESRADHDGLIVAGRALRKVRGTTEEMQSSGLRRRPFSAVARMRSAGSKLHLENNQLSHSASCGKVGYATAAMKRQLAKSSPADGTGEHQRQRPQSAGPCLVRVCLQDPTQAAKAVQAEWASERNAGSPQQPAERPWETRHIEHMPPIAAEQAHTAGKVSKTRAGVGADLVHPKLFGNLTPAGLEAVASLTKSLRLL